MAVTNIGHILVTHEGEKPFRSSTVMGEERSRALGRFLRGFPVEGYEFWLWRGTGPAGTLKTVEDANVDPDVVDYYWDENGEPKKGR